MHTYTSNIDANGRCEAVFPINDQITNYYHVVGEAPDTETGQTYKESQMLVLVVGGV
jgi:hypothetical protein